MQLIVPPVSAPGAKRADLWTTGRAVDTADPRYTASSRSLDQRVEAALADVDAFAVASVNHR
jgi:hypothetical protein